MKFKTLIFKKRNKFGEVVFCAIDKTAKGYKNYPTTIPQLYDNSATAETLTALGVDMSDLELKEIEMNFTEIPKFLAHFF